MIINNIYKLFLVFLFVLISIFSAVSANPDSLENQYNLPYPYNSNSSSGLFMSNPPNFNFITTYDLKNNQYLMQKKIGDFKLGYPNIMSFDEFQKYNFNKSISDYWNRRSKDRSSQQNTRFGIPKLYIPGQAFDKVFGGNSVDIRPQVSAELIFGLKINRLDNPSLTEEQRRTTTLIFKKKYK